MTVVAERRIVPQDVAHVERPKVLAGTKFTKAQVVEGQPFPGAASHQVVKGLGVLSGEESRMFSSTGAPVAIVAYIAGADSKLGFPQMGIDGQPETIRDLALGPVTSEIPDDDGRSALEIILAYKPANGQNKR